MKLVNDVMGPAFVVPGREIEDLLVSSIARQEVLAGLCVSRFALPTLEELDIVHEELDEHIWRQRWRKFC